MNKTALVGWLIFGSCVVGWATRTPTDDDFSGWLRAKGIEDAVLGGMALTLLALLLLLARMMSCAVRDQRALDELNVKIARQRRQRRPGPHRPDTR